jgi:hypothetical protein
VKQGGLGDCYFLSVLSCTAENPERIRNLFETEDLEEGQYAINITKNGEKKTIYIDDQFPCLYKRPIFSRANGNELWVLVLEKAWAKEHGTYKRIESGESHKTFRDVLGAPAWEYKNSEEDDAFALILEADK